MKIFHVSSVNLPSEGAPGGAKRHVIEVINGLSENNHVTAFLKGAPKTIDYLCADQIRFYQSCNRLGYIGTYLSFLKNFFLESFLTGKPDVVYAREMPFFCHSVIPPKLCQVPSLIEVNGFLPESQPMLSGYRSKYYLPLILIEALNYWMSDRIVSVSETARRKIAKFYGTQEDKIERIGNGADTEIYRPMKKEKSRNELGIPQDSFVVVFSGTFAPWSGIEDLIEALPYLEESIPEFRCLILSGKKDRERIWNLSSKLGVDDLIDMRGYIPWDELPLYLNSADVAVNPLRANNHSGDSLKTYEYLACGLPVVCSDVEELEKFVKQDRAGELFDPGDSKDMATKILNLYRNDEMRSECAQNARKSATQKYDWSHRLDQVEAVIRSVI